MPNSMDTYLPIDLEKQLKPESTIKDLIKFFKNNKDLFNNLHDDLAYMLDRFDRSKFDEIYSTPNSYDYLDDFSLLKHVVNELLRLSKIKVTTANSGVQFEFFLKVLLESCLESKCKILPPINWYYFMTSLIKSKFGTDLESQLIKLTVMQINNLNSAYSLVKNYLVDTNYFIHLKFESQLIVLEHLVGILDRFNLTLIRKFLNKLKLFLKQKSLNSRQEFNGFIHKIISSVYEFISRDKECSGDVLKEAVNFFVYLSKEFNFRPNFTQEIPILDLIVNVIEKLDDTELMMYLIKLEDILPFDERFLMNFYIRSKLVAKQYQPFMILNEPIYSIIKFYDVTNEETKSEFINLFSKLMLEISYKEYEFSLNQSTLVKSNSLKNNSLNWFMEYLNSLKSTQKNLEFSIQILSVIVYCWSNQSIELYDLKTSFLDEQLVLKNMPIYLQKFISHPFWKQIHLKLIDCLIFILTNNSFSNEFFEILKQSLFVLYKDTSVPDDVWFKYANLISTKFLEC
ncbi:unnamed protein product [Brachionus calyciflorus]|uniref:Focadhesin C-terminal domain-containing protein n=1 Tax=Brachionus calyciflorus TaxID=104777 RepID=A0A814GL84_9BILA|nr:unnamed protein product [Brachionus calyciflorus]